MQAFYWANRGNSKIIKEQKFDQQKIFYLLYKPLFSVFLYVLTLMLYFQSPQYTPNEEEEEENDGGGILRQLRNSFRRKFSGN